MLVPKSGNKNREFIQVEFDQAAAHIHHTPDFGITLPDNFEMAKYKNLNRAEKIQYAIDQLPRETIIGYQNAIGKSLCPSFFSCYMLK